MDLIKIGKFISECRKKQGLTQLQLADKLKISDRAVSKWETGRSMPDSSIMLQLCDVLQISVKELLQGEVIMNDEEKKEEELIMELLKEKQKTDKRLLKIEYYMFFLSIVILIGLLLLAETLNIEDWLTNVFYIISVVQLFITGLVCLRIEQVAGYYQCQKCGHKYVPTYLDINKAIHINKRRYLKCPKCNKKSWNKKVINK